MVKWILIIPVTLLGSQIPAASLVCCPWQGERVWQSCGVAVVVPRLQVLFGVPATPGTPKSCVGGAIPMLRGSMGVSAPELGFLGCSTPGVGHTSCSHLPSLLQSSALPGEPDQGAHPCPSPPSTSPSTFPATRLQQGLRFISALPSSIPLGALRQEPAAPRTFHVTPGAFLGGDHVKPQNLSLLRGGIAAHRVYPAGFAPFGLDLPVGVGGRGTGQVLVAWALSPGAQGQPGGLLGSDAASQGCSGL